MSFLRGLQLELMVYGYTREVERQNLLSEMIPNEIKREIMKWTKSVFDWKNCVPRRRGYTIVNENEIKYTSVGWSKLALKYDLSIRDGNKFEWELEPIQLSSRMGRPNMSWMMGFVQSPLEQSITDYQSAFWEKYHFGIHINSGGGNIVKYGRDGNHCQIYPQTHIDYKVNDRIRLVLDFKDKTIALYYNEQFAAVVYKDIPDVLCPVICCYNNYGCSLSISCNKFGPCT